MTDIVERLRSESTMAQRLILAPAIQREAADEIERLRAENATLREAMDDLEQEMRHLENLVQAAKDDGWSGGYSG